MSAYGEEVFLYQILASSASRRRLPLIANDKLFNNCFSPLKIINGRLDDSERTPSRLEGAGDSVIVYYMGIATVSQKAEWLGKEY